MILDVIFTELNSDLEVCFDDNNLDYDVDFGEVHVVTKGGYKFYEGSYEITPKTHEQVMETSEKIMENDVVIKEIPYREVPNVGGKGITVKIG